MRILTDSELEAVAGGLSITATSSLSVATSAVTTIAAGGASCALGANATGAGTSEAAMIEVIAESSPNRTLSENHSAISVLRKRSIPQ
jgi:hypothetical protein